jgi:hypothetical protein
MGPGPAFPSLRQLQQAPLWDLGLAMSGRLLLGSLLVGCIGAVLLGGGYWLLLEHKQRRRVNAQS